MTNQVNQDVIKPIEYDSEMDRFYIPVNSRYEIQTKGKGSSFRIANTSTHLRCIVLNDSLHPVLEDMAKATNAEMMQLKAATKASEQRIQELEESISKQSSILYDNAKEITLMQLVIENKDIDISELTASNNKLRIILCEVRDRFFPINQPESDKDLLWDDVNDTLSSTTTQSLEKHNNEVVAPYKKALEFAEYMAKSTEQFMIAINQLDEADQEEDEETIEIMQEKRGEHWRAVNSSIYEFRQRSDRALRASHG